MLEPKSRTWQSAILNANQYQFNRNKEEVAQDAKQIEVPNFAATSDVKNIHTENRLGQFDNTQKKYKIDVTELIRGRNDADRMDR